jgi:hypothetical protein
MIYQGIEIPMMPKLPNGLFKFTKQKVITKNPIIWLQFPTLAVRIDLQEFTQSTLPSLFRHRAFPLFGERVHDRRSRAFFERNSRPFDVTSFDAI